MKTHIALFTALLLAGRALALNIPSDGSDGNFSPGADIEVDLGQAITGAWDAENSANVGKGRYDASKWAVVFKYASVNIPVGVTVTFKNHPKNAPVVWLVNGNVTIAGTVKLDGKNWTNDSILRLYPVEAGPGGFRGGATGPSGTGTAFGPGGGNASGGPFGGNAGSYSTTYGNPQVLPLLGGSGGGAHTSGSTGSGGGGAIMIAAAGNIQHTGTLTANGGQHVDYGPAGGSGGAIRLIAEQVLGGGVVTAVTPGTSALFTQGRIRIETSLLSTTLQINPNTIAVPPPTVPIIFPAANAPTASVLSVAGVAAPADPSAPLISSADVGIQQNGNVDVIIQTTNFPTSGDVKLRVGPKYAAAVLVNATYLSGGFSSANWKATLTFNPGFSAMQAIATVP